MSKFKIGDQVQVKTVDREDIDKGYSVGDVVTVDEDDDIPYCIGDHGRHMFNQEQLELVTEDRTNLHPHHDVIVAWAKGAKIECRVNISSRWVPVAGPCPTWSPEKEYRVMTQPDHPAEIADIERKMRELSESQKELADRLEKLK